MARLAGAPLAIVLAVFALAGCARDAVDAEQSWPELERAVNEAAATGRAIEPVEALGTRRWDRLYVFGPYTPRDEIERRIGFKWRGATAIENQDAVQLLLAVDGNRVTRAVDLPRGKADFGCLAERPVRRKDRLVVRREPGKVPVVTVTGQRC